MKRYDPKDNQMEYNEGGQWVLWYDLIESVRDQILQCKPGELKHIKRWISSNPDILSALLEGPHCPVADDMVLMRCDKFSDGCRSCYTKWLETEED